MLVDFAQRVPLRANFYEHNLLISCKSKYIAKEHFRVHCRITSNILTVATK